jgi:DNA-binding NarL/FixJ family response regulator
MFQQPSGGELVTTDHDHDVASVERLPIRVFLLDDHEVVRRGIADLVETEPDMTVVGEASSSAEALSEVKRCQPDVAVLDVRLGDGNGITVCREIRATYPDVACLILTSFDDDRAIVDAAISGAAGFVLKQIRSNDLIDSIRRVAAGARLLDDAETRMAMERIRKSEGGMIDTLTEQERRVFDLIGNGCSNRQIADELFLAEKTVKNYVSNMFSKLGIVRRTEAAALAARLEERNRLRYQ